MLRWQSLRHWTVLSGLLAGHCLEAFSHFQELIPNCNIVEHPAQSHLDFDIRFTHPMNGGPVMNMPAPRKFEALSAQGRENLTSRLKAVTETGVTRYQAQYRLRQPDDYVFVLEPAPYWEPAEQRWIQHYAKTVVSAFGAESGWDHEAGLPMEIVPLARPYGLWTHNLFSGIVKRQGQPLPFAEIEVEWRNDGTLQAPTGPYVTQRLKADDRGIFHYAMPRAGWWGFAALATSDARLPGPDGKPAPVEMGGIIWVFTRDMK